MKYAVYEEIFWAIMRNDLHAIKDLDQKHGHTELIQGSIRMCETKRANMLGYLLIDALSEKEIQRLLITPDEERNEIDKRLLSIPLDRKLKEESLPNPDEIRQKTNTVLRNVKAEKWTEFFKREMPYEFAAFQQSDTLSQESIEKMIGDEKLSQKVCNTIACMLIHELIKAYDSKKKEIKPLLEITEGKMREKVFDSLTSSLSTELQHSFFGSSLGTPNKFLMEIVLSQYVKENPREMHESGHYITDIEKFLRDWQKELIIVFTSKSALTENAVKEIFHLPPSSTENLFVIERLIEKAMLSLNELKPLWKKRLKLAELEIDRQETICLLDNKINRTGLPSNVLHGLLVTHQKKIYGFDSQIEKVKGEIKDLKMLCFEQYESEYSNLSPEVEKIVQAKKAYKDIIDEWTYFRRRQAIQIPKTTDDPSEVKPFVDALNAFIEEHPEKNFDKYNNLDYRVKTISRAIKRIALRKFFEQNFELLKSCFAEDGASFQKTLENLVKAPMRELLEKYPNIDALPDQIKEKIIDQLTDQPLSINALTYINELLILNLSETVTEQNDRLKKTYQFHSNKSNETHEKFYCFHNLTAEILKIVTTENRETLNQRLQIR